jgi:hypothetical protein
MGEAMERASKQLESQTGSQQQGQGGQQADGSSESGEQSQTQQGGGQPGEQQQDVAQGGGGEQGDRQEQGQGEQGEHSTSTPPGKNSSPGGESSEKSSLEDLAKQMERAQELSEKLQRDRQAMRRAQELNGALESTSQRLGSESEMADGESSQQGQGQQGQGQQEQGQQGQGAAQGIIASGASQGESRPGQGHTWEDEGPQDALPSHQDANRQSDRRGGQQIDDFEQIYRGVRIEGAESLLVGEDGVVDESGHQDIIHSRLTEGHADAAAPILTVPPQYREAADRSLTDETIPPAYREAIKNYFDGME